jgi:predicted Zn-dependent peptidase
MEIVLSNGIKVIYIKGSSKLTSFSIGINAGAALEENLLGLAHMTEHMVYKGTKKRSEGQINEDLTKLFGFQNAMTNYPYVIYYGSLLEEDLEDGVELFSDIILNPIFDEEGFEEERQVVLQELKEWDEELEQFCEDKLFYNAYTNNRLKYPIIGREEDLKKIGISDIKNFYNNYYCPKNTSIAVVSGLEQVKVIEILEKYFDSWNKESQKVKPENKELPKQGVFKSYKAGINSARVQAIFPLNNLTHRELASFRIFNELFGEGVNSVLFDKLRTKNALVYDVLTSISYEKHINLYKVTFATSMDKLERALQIFNKAINDEYIVDKARINELNRAIKRKKLFKEEQCIYLAKELSINSVMERSFNLYPDISVQEIVDVKEKVLRNCTIQIIIPKEVM